MKDIGLDSVWLQPVMVPHWVRGEKEEAFYTIKGEQKNVPICALGFSIATPSNGLTGEVIEVTSDGKKNHIINGICDWVYEEEFSFVRAFLDLAFSLNQVRLLLDLAPMVFE